MLGHELVAHKPSFMNDVLLFTNVLYERPLKPNEKRVSFMNISSLMNALYKCFLGLVFLSCILLSGCATDRLTLHIDRKEAVINRGNFPTPMVELGGSAVAQYVGEYSVTTEEYGKTLIFLYHCYSIAINGVVYYLSIPKHGDICLIENACPDHLTRPQESLEDLRIKFVDGGGSSTSDYQKNYSVTDGGKYNAVLRQNEKSKEYGPFFHRVRRYHWEGIINGIGIVRDVLVPTIYASEGYLMIFENGKVRWYELALNIRGNNATRVCNQSKRAFYLLTVPFDIAFFPWAIYDSLDMMDH